METWEELLEEVPVCMMMVDHIENSNAHLWHKQTTEEEELNTSKQNIGAEKINTKNTRNGRAWRWERVVAKNVKVAE